VPLFRGPPPDPFPGVLNPSEVQQAAGAWLAKELSSEGFVWRKDGRLVRRKDGQVECVHLFADKYNSKVRSRYDLRAVRLDAGLKAWRGNNANHVLAVWDWAGASGRPYMLDLVVGKDRLTPMRGAEQWVRSFALPFFRTWQDPELVVQEWGGPLIGEAWPRPVVEFLLWQKRADLVPKFLSIVDRTWSASSHAGELRAGLQRGRQLAQSGATTNVETNSYAAVALGWLLERQGLSGESPTVS
jgi:hypothetical protein